MTEFGLIAIIQERLKFHNPTENDFLLPITSVIDKMSEGVKIWEDSSSIF